MNMKSLVTPLIVISTAMWGVVTVLGWDNNNYAICLVLSMVIEVAYVMLGCAKKGKLDKKFFIYPILSWGILWAAGFAGAAYFSEIYAGQVPPLFLSLHPSLACIVVCFWLGGLVTFLAGWYIGRDNWMSRKDWDDYCERVKKINSESGKK